MNCRKQSHGRKIYTRSNIPQENHVEHEVSDFVTNFICKFQVGKLLFKCNAGKKKKIPVMDIFRFLLCPIFSDKSMYVQMKANTFHEVFSKNTVYRFLNSIKINWYRFTTLLSAKIFCDFTKPLTNDNRKDVFIIDDSLYSHFCFKKTECLTKESDHYFMRYKQGYRVLTLYWSDGNSFIPVNYCLLSTTNDKNLLCEAKHCDGPSLLGKWHSQSR